MKVEVEIQWADLNPDQQSMLLRNKHRQPFSVGTWEENEIRNASELVALGLLVDEGLAERNYRNRIYVVSIVGHAFMRQSGKV